MGCGGEGPRGGGGSACFLLTQCTRLVNQTAIVANETLLNGQVGASLSIRLKLNYNPPISGASCLKENIDLWFSSPQWY